MCSMAMCNIALLDDANLSLNTKYNNLSLNLNLPDSGMQDVLQVHMRETNGPYTNNLGWFIIGDNSLLGFRSQASRVPVRG